MFFKDNNARYRAETLTCQDIIYPIYYNQAAGNWRQQSVNWCFPAEMKSVFFFSWSWTTVVHFLLVSAKDRLLSYDSHRPPVINPIDLSMVLIAFRG